MKLEEQAPGNPALRIRRLREDDLPFADRLRDLAGWNQTPADWRRFLDLEPRGCLLAEWNGAAAGTATTLVHGRQEVAWIGMVLVHPDYRRRGIGRGLLTGCIEHLRAGNVPCIKLDATPAGQPVYEALGFRQEWTLTRWEHPCWQPVAFPRTDDPRPWRTSDLDGIEAVDRPVFGVSRWRLLEALGKASTSAAVLTSGTGSPTGYGFLRAGARASYLGPVVAPDAGAGLALVQAVLEQARGERVFWDIPDQNVELTAWACTRGFTRQRSLTRMSLGTNASPGIPSRQMAISGPETG